MSHQIQELLNRTGALAENEVKDFLQSFGITTTKYIVIKDIDDLTDFPLQFPVALKVCSAKILHKTDVKGVQLNIQNMEELTKILKQFQKRFPKESFLVDQMVDKGVEVIVGLVQDPTFGLTIMCGVGGIYTELYQDVSFRVVPIDHLDAAEMIEEIKGKKLLEGFRNIKASKEKVKELLLQVSSIGEQYMDRIDQMDLNPVFVYEDGICVVDAKLLLK